MIVNSTIIKNKYKCREKIKEYLVFECHLPILSYDGDGYFYFTRTSQLEQCLNNMPLRLKLLDRFGK